MLEALIKDQVSGAVFRREQGLYLRPPDPGLALSTVLLANRLEPLPVAAAQPPAAPLAAPDRFLQAGDRRIIPSARRQFRNGENMVLYFEVYNAGVSPGTRQTDITLRLRLLNDGQPADVKLPEFRVTEAPDAEAKLIVTRFVQLAGLAPGDYSLVVEVSDNTAQAIERAHASFSIVR